MEGMDIHFFRWKNQRQKPSVLAMFLALVLVVVTGRLKPMMTVEDIHTVQVFEQLDDL
jgi:hypothetical protein